MEDALGLAIEWTKFDLSAIRSRCSRMFQIARLEMTKDNSRPATFPLRLPVSMRRQAIDLAQKEGLSLNQFISLAVAEKITRLEQSTWLERRVHSSNGAVVFPGRMGEQNL